MPKLVPVEHDPFKPNEAQVVDAVRDFLAVEAQERGAAAKVQGAHAKEARSAVLATVRDFLKLEERFESHEARAEELERKVKAQESELAAHKVRDERNEKLVAEQKKTIEEHVRALKVQEKKLEAQEKKLAAQEARSAEALERAKKLENATRNADLAVASLEKRLESQGGALGAFREKTSADSGTLIGLLREVESRGKETAEAVKDLGDLIVAPRVAVFDRSGRIVGAKVEK